MAVDFDAIVTAVKSYTMVCDSGVRFAAQSAIDVVERRISGVIVECGVWKGGCSLAMLLAQRMAFGRVERPVFMFDSFEGMPEPGPKDGAAAREWRERRDPSDFHDNCRADQSNVSRIFEDLFGFRALPGLRPEIDYELSAGLFESTLPRVMIGPIALLRLDADWYESTKCCLDNLGRFLSPGALVIVDDYYAWEGCKLAVNEWLAGRPEITLESMPDGSAAHFRMPG